jgi:gluconolactonase
MAWRFQEMQEQKWIMKGGCKMDRFRMNGPVEELETEVFAELPTAFRRQRPANSWVQVQRSGKHVDALFEGPTFDRAGNLYVSDIPWGRIFRISTGGDVELVTEYDGEPNGLAIHRDGRIFVADTRNGVVTVDPGTGDVTPVVPRAEIEGFKGLSDMVFSQDGDLYFTDQGLTGMHDPTGRVYRYGADGRLTRLIDTVPSPNGIVLDASDRVLYVSATRGNAVWRAPLLNDGVTKVGIHVQLSGGHGPDGLAFDTEGNLAVAHAGAGQALVFGPHGDLRTIVRSCRDITVTSVAFSPGEPNRLYLTEAESGSVLFAPWPRAGQPLFSHKSE